MKTIFRTLSERCKFVGILNRRFETSETDFPVNSKLLKNLTQNAG